MTTRNQYRDDFGFADRLARWLQDRNHESVLTALATPRSEVFSVAEVVDTLLAAPEIRRVKLSFQLWGALLEKTEEDIERLLLEEVPADALAVLRLALWGDDPHRRTRPG